MNGETMQPEMQTNNPTGSQDRFRARMAAQICLIETYRREQWQKFGRRLSSNDAASEWIARFAADFPQSLTV